MNEEKAICGICGEPMPEGEEMFMYHGYSGDCPKPPKKTTVIGVDPGSPEGDRTVVYTPEKWLIWSIEHNGWWAPAERGYVHNKNDAGVYSYERACEIVAGANRDMQRPNEAMVKIEIPND